MMTEISSRECRSQYGVRAVTRPSNIQATRAQKRKRLRFELLETRRLLAFDAMVPNHGIDLDGGFCWSISSSIDYNIAPFAPTVSQDAEAIDSQKFTPVPEGVGVMPLEPPELSEMNRQFWEMFAREDNSFGSWKSFDEGMFDPGDAGGDSGASGGASSAGSFQPFDLADTFRLHSRPTSTKTLYLDFNGFEARGTLWNQSYNIPVIVSPPYDPAGDGPEFNNGELLQIQQIWHRVAEHFAPFDVNVTTEEPPESDLVRTGPNDDRWGLRVVQTVDNFANCRCGGFAYINSFNWGYNTPGATDTPAYSFNSTGTAAAITISHEAGHALGLSHDGSGSNAYYGGHGTGETRWGPIMGAAFNANVQHWSRGEYTGANNAGANANYNRGPDDLEIITTFNGFGYREDEAGGTINTAAQMYYHSVNSADPTLIDVSFFGVITTRDDVDMIRFETGTGEINLIVDSYAGRAWVSDDEGGFTPKIQSTNFSSSWSANLGSSLDVLARIYDSTGTIIAESNPVGLSASFIGLSLTGGTYYLSVEGTGFGNPFASPPTGYTDYGSLGQYFVRGTVVDVSGPRARAVTNDIEFTTSEAVVINVTYTDDVGIDIETLRTGNIGVAGPNDYDEIAIFLGIVDASDLRSIVVQYSIPAPSESWSVSSNGDYLISLFADEVANLDGEFIEPGVIGRFNVDIAPTLGPDGFGHIAYPIPFEFQDISQTGTFILGGADDRAVSITPGNGFSFSFYGVVYETLFVSSNGLLTFGAGNSDFVNTDLTNSPETPTIAVYWDDLIARSNEGVYWQLFGSGEEQYLVVQWETGYFGGNGEISFQAILREDGNTIQVNYRDLAGGHSQRDEGMAATVGLKAGGVQGDNRLMVSFNGSGRRYVETGRSLYFERANRPMSDLILSSQAINENLPAGSLIGTFTTIDPDDGETFTYDLVSGDGSEDNANFEIVGDQLRSIKAFDFEQTSSQSIRVRTTDSVGHTLERTFLIEIIDLPELESIVVANGQLQRSRVDRLEVTFDGVTTWEEGAFRIIRRGSGNEVNVTVTSDVDDQGRTIAELVFSGSLTRANGALVDGNYQLIIDGSKIFRNGQNLDSNGDGVGGDTFNFGDEVTDQFFALYGDVDGDRQISTLDFLALRSSFGSSIGSSAYNRNLDFDDNGFIDTLDFLEFRSRFGSQLNF